LHLLIAHSNFYLLQHRLYNWCCLDSKLCCIGGKFAEVLIWQFGGLEEIAKLNSANIKPAGWLPGYCTST